MRKFTTTEDVKKSILDIDIIAVCQSACGSAGITANVFGLGEVWENKEYIVIFGRLVPSRFRSDKERIVESNVESAIVGKTVLADSTPSQECYKSGEPCKYDCSGLCKDSC